jgi:penicillin-binding protein 2
MSILKVSQGRNVGIAILGVLFSILIMKAFFLQVLQGKYYRALSQENIIQRKFLKAPRGIIFSQEGTPVAKNKPYFNLYLSPQSLSRLEKGHLKELLQKLNISETKFSSLTQRYLLKTGATLLEVMKIEEQPELYSGVEIEVEARREYPFGEVCFHPIGYVGRVNAEEFKKLKTKGYLRNDFIGKAGIEKIAEEYLRGTHGIEFVVVDAYGKKVNLDIASPFLIPETPGHNITLTLTLKLQQRAYQLLKDKKGVIIVSIPKTGEILALVSSPAINPNCFYWPDVPASLQAEDAAPFVNRALEGQYPPGSLFKIIVAAGALEERVIKEEWSVNCKGVFQLGRREYRCWQKHGHGKVDLKEALIQSCNIFFFRLGQRCKMKLLIEYAQKFGLGKSAYLELPGEQLGFIPPFSEAKRYPLGETLLLSIGQGRILVTPLQMLKLVSILANKGVFYQPQLIKKIETIDGKVIYKFQPRRISEVKLSPKTFQRLEEALLGVVATPRGTGYPCYLEGIEICGKTGTAQVCPIPEEDTLSLSEEQLPHAWFLGYAPRRSPKVVVVVLIEHGEKGSYAAAVAREIFKAYFFHSSPKRGNY